MVVTHILDVTERKRIQDELLYSATHDALTRVPNRYLLEKTINLSLANKRHHGALLFIDVDNLKLVNDTLGHLVGDELLVNIVTILRNNLHKQDFIARLGGDEFAVLLDAVSMEQAKTIAETLRKAVEAARLYPEFSITPLTTSISIGVAPLDSKTTAGNALSQADYLLYQAKDQGRNRVVAPEYENDTKNKLSETSQLIHTIREALENERFLLYFQPVVNTASGQIIHQEGLIRLVEEGGKVILPGEFIPAAERFGLMPLIDRKVVGLAFQSLSRYPDLRLFINLSGISLGNDGLLSFIVENIQKQAIEPSRLGFEITETTAVRDIPQAERWIRKLKELGCPFALDDFGIGFSSFSYLQNLPVDFVKIDGSFVRDLDVNERHRVLVQAMHTAATSLGKETIAEFVETDNVFKILREYGVNHVQGYYLGKPDPVPKICRIEGLGIY